MLSETLFEKIWKSHVFQKQQDWLPNEFGTYFCTCSKDVNHSEAQVSDER